MLAVKENQPTLLVDIKAVFAAATERDDLDDIVDFAKTTNTGHGRTETRRCLTCSELLEISRSEDWPKLATVVMIELERTTRDNASIEQRYFTGRTHQTWSVFDHLQKGVELAASS